MSTTDTTTALALADAFDRHYLAGTRPALPAAMAELGITDATAATKLLICGSSLQYARDYGLDELAQLALVLPLDAVRADRPAAYARLTPAHVDEWAPEVAAGGETTVAALREMLAYVTRGPEIISQLHAEYDRRRQGVPPRDLGNGIRLSGRIKLDSPPGPEHDLYEYLVDHRPAAGGRTRTLHVWAKASGVGLEAAIRLALRNEADERPSTVTELG
jgi:hypothetical protein